MDNGLNLKKGILFGICLFFGITSMFLLTKGSYSNTDVETTEEIINKIIIQCDDVSPGPLERVSCTIKGIGFTSQISSFSGKLVLSDHLTLSNISFDSESWQGSVENGEIDLYTDTNKTGDFDIATFAYETTDINTGIDSSILLQEIYTSDENFDEKTWDDVLLDVRVASNINTLSSLVVSGLEFDFVSTITAYNLTLDLAETTIEVIADNEHATVSGDIGVETLNFGENTLVITVTSESGIVKEYILVITRNEKLSFDEDLVLDDVSGYLKMYVSDITVNDMLNKVDTTGVASIVDENGIEVAGASIVKTGNKIVINLSETYEYPIIVMGDTTGDGLVTVSDVSKLFQYFRGTLATEFSELSFMAGNVKNDDIIKLSDVAKLFQYVRGTIPSLKDETSN